MSILILNRSDYNNLPYKKILSQIRMKLVVLSDVRKEKDFPVEEFDYCEFFSNYDKNGNVQLRAMELHQKYDFKHIIATSEFDLLRAAELREWLNIKGQSIESATAFRNKTVMKEILKTHVNVPSFKEINNIKEVNDFINKFDFPLVIKPINDSGSNNVHLIYNSDDLKRCLETNIVRGYQIEKFVDGKMYTIDGLYNNNNISVCWFGYYLDDCLSFLTGKQASVIQISENCELTDRLGLFIKKILDVLPADHTTPFHCEVFHTNDDELVLCEIASRTGGGGINTLGLLKFGVNLNYEFVKGQCGFNETEKKIIDPISDKFFGFIQIPARHGTLKYMPSIDEIPYDFIESYDVKGELGKFYKGAKKSSHKIAIVVISGENEKQLKTNMEISREWIEDKIEWSVL